MLTKMSRSDLKEIAGGFVLLVLAAVSFSQLGTGTRDWIFPRVLTYLLGGIGIVLIVGRLVVVGRRGQSEAVAEASMSRSERLNLAVDVGGISAVAVAYAVFIPEIGFWSTSFFVIAGMAIWLNERRSAQVIALAVTVALLVVIAGYYVFLHVFYVPIPTGVFGWLQ